MYIQKEIKGKSKWFTTKKKSNTKGSNGGNEGQMTFIY